jgi:hypothetical protein
MTIMGARLSRHRWFFAAGFVGWAVAGALAYTHVIDWPTAVVSGNGLLLGAFAIVERLRKRDLAALDRQDQSPA